MNRFLIYIILVVLALYSCGNDDDGPVEISIEEQNTQDDGAIQTFLQEYYFDELGRVVAFDDSDPDDDNETPLKDIALQVGDGVYYAMNQEVTPTGNMVTNVDTQKILLNYDLKIFNSAHVEGEYTVNNFSSYTSTINTSGLPTWDVPFYRIDLEEDATNDESYYEMPGFKEAIVHFQSTNKQLEEPYIFQGVIIMPSRANFGRDPNYYGMYNSNAVISFEIYQVQDDE